MKMRTKSSDQTAIKPSSPVASAVTLLKEGPALPRLVFILLLLWAFSLVLSIPLGGFHAFDEAFVIATLYKVLAVLITGRLAYGLLLQDRREKYLSFRKYLGYAGVVGYFALALPALAWEDAAYVDRAGALWLWAINFSITALLSAAWILLYSLRGRAFFGLITEAEIKNRKLRKEMTKSRDAERPRRPVWKVITENVDQFIQVVLMVIVLQTFVFQLYVIPSESLVPTMLIGDRPFVVKTLDGPAMPLSNVRFPAASKIDRNNIVVFESPAAQKLPLIKQVFNQFVFLMTLSLVNLDTDENGAPIERMIVKRVIGLPGDRLMMVDDKVYIAGADGKFVLLEGDDNHGNVNLQRLPEDIRKEIKELRITDDRRLLFDKMDRERSDLDRKAVQEATKRAAERIETGLAALGSERVLSFGRFMSGSIDTADNVSIKLLASTNMQPWRYLDGLGGPQSDTDFRVIFAMARDAKVRAAFKSFLSDVSTYQADDLYQDAIKNLNLMYRRNLAERYAALVDALRSQAGFADLASQPAYAAQLETARNFYIYMNYFDMRNFPAFPSSGVIPPDHYFLMGDNRYNSLDFRYEMHGNYKERSLDANDPNSLIYESMLAPRLLERERIIGHVVFRLFPLNRLGTVP